MMMVRHKKFRAEVAEWGNAVLGHSRTSILSEVEREGQSLERRGCGSKTEQWVTAS